MAVIGGSPVQSHFVSLGFKPPHSGVDGIVLAKLGRAQSVIKLEVPKVSYILNFYEKIPGNESPILAIPTNPNVTQNISR